MKKILFLLFLLPLSMWGQNFGAAGASANNPKYSVNTPALGSTDISTDSILKLIQKRIEDSIKTYINVLNFPDSTKARLWVNLMNQYDSSKTSRSFVTVSNLKDSIDASRAWINILNWRDSTTQSRQFVTVPNVVTTKPETVDYYSVTTQLVTGLAVVANATDFATLRGSATKTVYVTRVILEQVAATATNNISIVKRSTANVGGTSTTSVISTHNSTSPASTSLATFYTVNPTALGTLAGILQTRKHRTIATNGLATNNALIFDYTDRPIVLNGITQFLCLNSNALNVANSSSIVFEFYEK